MKQLFTGICLLISIALFAQSKIEDKTRNMRAFKGYFNFWWEDKEGKIWLLVDKWNTEFLYATSLPAGLGSNDIGLDRGLTGECRVVYFERVGKKVLLVEPNYAFRAGSPNLQEQRAVRESFAQSVLFSFSIAEEENGNALVDATPFLLRDAMGISDRLRTLKQGTYSLNEPRSAIFLPNTRNFPKNSEFESIITFTGGSDAGKLVQSVVPSPEAITLRAHHSLVQLPDTGYHPRSYDVRSGFIATAYYDFSSPLSAQVQKLFITRHRLQKQNPLLPKSEVVKPITYYLDPGTPEPIRSALLDGARWWTKAFEAAGFLNAFSVELLPDSADPMDIRYHVINWVHRSTRGWSYGASVTDPRTGEIIKGQVSLGSLRVRQDYQIFAALLSPYFKGVVVSERAQKAALQRLRQLAAHEVGHTLGLMHNYASSANGRASVMDYPHPKLYVNRRGEIDFDEAYTDEIGAWDKRAILYGYAQFAEGENDSKLNVILEETARLGLDYISDVDARSANGIHPNAHLWDNGDNAIAELTNVLDVRDKALRSMNEQVLRTGEPIAKMEDALVPVYNYHRYQLEAVCKLIGGLNYRYQVKDDRQTSATPVKREIQQEALSKLIACLKPEVLRLPQILVDRIPPRPPYYYNIGEQFARRTGISFDALAPAEALVQFELGFLLNPERANRLMQQKAMYNNLGFDDIVRQLINATWGATTSQNMDGQIAMQTQHILLTWLLGLAQNERSNYLTRSIATQGVQEIRRLAVSRQSNPNEFVRAHYEYAIARIDEKKEVPLPIHLEMAPGAPIGCDW